MQQMAKFLLLEGGTFTAFMLTATFFAVHEDFTRKAYFFLMTISGSCVLVGSFLLIQQEPAFLFPMLILLNLVGFWYGGVKFLEGLERTGILSLIKSKLDKLDVREVALHIRLQLAKGYTMVNDALRFIAKVAGIVISGVSVLFLIVLNIVGFLEVLFGGPIGYVSPTVAKVQPEIEEYFLKGGLSICAIGIPIILPLVIILIRQDRYNRKEREVR